MVTAEGMYPKAGGDPHFASEATANAGVIAVEAGENITADDAVYILDTDGKAYISDTATAADCKFDGFALNTDTSGNTIYVQTSGLFQNLSSLTAQEIYYIGAAGAVTTTYNDYPIGVATSTTALFILPDIDKYGHGCDDYSVTSATYDSASAGSAAANTVNSGSIILAVFATAAVAAPGGCHWGGAAFADSNGYGVIEVDDLTCTVAGYGGDTGVADAIVGGTSSDNSVSFQLDKPFKLAANWTTPTITATLSGSAYAAIRMTGALTIYYI